MVFYSSNHSKMRRCFKLDISGGLADLDKICTKISDEILVLILLKTWQYIFLTCKHF